MSGKLQRIKEAEWAGNFTYKKEIDKEAVLSLTERYAVCFEVNNIGLVSFDGDIKQYEYTYNRMNLTKENLGHLYQYVQDKEFKDKLLIVIDNPKYFTLVQLKEIYGKCGGCGVTILSNISELSDDSEYKTIILEYTSTVL